MEAKLKARIKDEYPKVKFLDSYFVSGFGLSERVAGIHGTEDGILYRYDLNILTNKLTRSIPALLFEAFQSDERKMWTQYVECVPEQSEIEAMAKSGHKFRINGKWVAKSNVWPTIKSLNIEGAAPSIVKSNKTRSVKKIKCIETGDVYKNMTEAGKAMGIDPAYISDAVRLNKPAKGYHFERVEE